MTTGRIKTIDTISTVSGARKISYGKGDLRIYRIVDSDNKPYLRYIIDPRSFTSNATYTATGNVRGTGQLLTSTSTNLSLTSAVSTANNMEAFVCNGSGTSGGGISLVASNSPMTESFSYACVFTLSQAWIDSKYIIRFMASIDTNTTTARTWAGVSTSNFYFGPTADVANTAIAGVTITAGVPIILVGTYNNSTKVSNLSVRTGGTTITATRTAASSLTVASTDSLSVCGAGPLATGFGHSGYMFKNYFFNNALTATQVNDVISALKTGYAAA